MRTWTFGFGALALTAGVVASCGTGEHGPVSSTSDASTSVASFPIAESASAALRIADHRARFVMEREAAPTRGEPQDTRAKTPLRVPALASAIASGFERSGAGGLRAVLPAGATRGVARPAVVELPQYADGESQLEDVASNVSVRFRLHDARPTAVAVANGYALYAAALGGEADIVHRVHAEGTEDYVIFETRPAREELRYDVDVSQVPGLRLVSNTLEFLDERGSPTLRVAPPYVVDAHGTRSDAKLSVSGCAYDTSTAAPWGRSVTRPGAARCALQITWTAEVYPAIVDPAWVATGSMATVRSGHTATVLTSGKVLVVGGNGSSATLASAELFDPAGNGGVGTFAATASMTAARTGHTATLLPSGKVLIVGAAGVSAEIFDPAGNGGAGAFVTTGAMTTARSGHSVSLLHSGKVLVAGGASSPSALASAELFDPAGNAGAGTFTATGSMVDGREGHTSSVLPSGKVLVAGGWQFNPNGPLGTAELFDPAGNAGAGTFAVTGSMAGARDEHTATVLPSGKALIVGGFAGSYLASAELFDPAGNAGAGSFGVTGTMVSGRWSHTATLLPSGTVLFTGGTNKLSQLAVAELYDPAGNGGAGSFAAATAMTTIRVNHTANLLPSGKVLVVGGGNAQGLLATAELYGGAIGDACSVNGYCASGACANGVCCDSACGGCRRCDLPNKVGLCSVVSVGDPGANPVCTSGYACDGVNADCPTSCASDAACALAYYCAPSGTCQPRKPQASACNMAADCKAPGCRECTTGFCVDGYCCDQECGGACVACSATNRGGGGADGTCGPIKDGIDPRNACALSGVLCGADGQCDGAGECRAVTRAGVSCSADGKVCDGSGTCVLPPAATCDGDHTITAQGRQQDCSPYKCAGDGTCKKPCASAADCVAPTLCTPAGECSAAAPESGNSGCATSGRGAPSMSAFYWLGAAGVLLVARRRRRSRTDGESS